METVNGPVLYGVVLSADFVDEAPEKRHTPQLAEKEREKEDQTTVVWFPLQTVIFRIES